MSPRLLLDEDSQAKYLVNLLRAAEHDVTTANEAQIVGFPDREVLAYAIQTHRVLLTRNCDDFQELHQHQTIHHGIFAIYQDPEAAKQMSYPDIVRAIGNLEAAGLELAGQFVALNSWNY